MIIKDVGIQDVSACEVIPTPWRFLSLPFFVGGLLGTATLKLDFKLWIANWRYWEKDHTDQILGASLLPK